MSMTNIADFHVEQKFFYFITNAQNKYDPFLLTAAVILVHTEFHIISAYHRFSTPLPHHATALSLQNIRSGFSQ